MPLRSLHFRNVKLQICNKQVNYIILPSIGSFYFIILGIVVGGKWGRGELNLKHTEFKFPKT